MFNRFALGSLLLAVFVGIIVSEPLYSVFDLISPFNCAVDESMVQKPSASTV